MRNYNYEHYRQVVVGIHILFKVPMDFNFIYLLPQSVLCT